MIERYEDENVAMVFNPVAQLQRWCRVEVTQMRRVRGEQAATRLHSLGAPDPARVADWELRTKHDVFAFLLAYDELIQERAQTESDCAELRQWLHYGLTSSDVADTAQALALVEVHQYLTRLASVLLATLSSVCLKLANLPEVMGRTHGQYAVPMPAEHRWQVLYSELVGVYQQFSEVQNGLHLGKLSGPVGVGIDGDEQSYLQRLGLSSALSTQLVPRGGLVRWAQAQANMATVCEAIATQIWLLSQAGVAEVVERQDPGQVGSSAMPHKTNPIRAENIRGLARLARMYAEVLQPSMVQWGEHDLAHSCVERVALPDLCHTMAAILRRTTTLLDSIEFQEKPLPESYVNTHEKLLELQRSGVPYVRAHEQLRTGTYRGGTMDEQLERAFEALDPNVAGFIDADGSYTE